MTNYSGLYENKSAFYRISHQSDIGFDKLGLYSRIKNNQSLVRLYKSQKRNGETLIAESLMSKIKTNLHYISIAYLDRSNGYRI